MKRFLVVAATAALPFSIMIATGRATADGTAPAPSTVTTTIGGKPMICMEAAELAKLQKKCETASSSDCISKEEFDQLQKDFEALCPGVTLKKVDGKYTVEKKADTTPKPTVATTSKPSATTPPLPTASTVPIPVPTTPPKKVEWTGVGNYIQPKTAPSPDAFTCVDSKGEKKTDWIVVRAAVEHTAACGPNEITSDLKGTIDWLAELDEDNGVTKDLELRKASLDAKRKAFSRIELIVEGLDDPELKGFLKRVRDRLTAVEGKVRAMLRSLCDIENPDDPKWTTEAIEKQCKEAADARAELSALRVMSGDSLPTKVWMAGGPNGMQVGLSVGYVHQFAYLYKHVTPIVGIDVGGTFAAPKTGGQAFIWPYLGLRFLPSDPREPGSISVDLKAGVRQHISTVYGHEPVINGQKYENSQFWGSYATGGLDLMVRGTSWLSVGVGGWVGYGWWLSTVPDSPRKPGLNGKLPTLPEDKGIGGGGHLIVSVTF